MKPILSIVAIAGLLSFTACNRTALQEKEAALAAQQHTIDSVNTELTRKKVVDSMSELTRVQYMMPQNALATAPYTSQAPKVVYVRQARTRSYSGYSHPTTTSSNAPVIYQQVPVKQRRGWSAKAKGAVIGAGTGAVAGAIINGRNRVAGAVIGGLLGAGAGTGIGAIIDGRNGR